MLFTRAEAFHQSEEMAEIKIAEMIGIDTDLDLFNTIGFNFFRCKRNTNPANENAGH